MRTMRNLLAKKAVVTVLAVGISLAAVNAFWGGSDSALSQLGSSGSEVRAIQEVRLERQVRRLCVRWAFLSALCRRLRSRTSIFWRG